MGILDSLRKFADKKKDEYKREEYKRNFNKQVENYAYQKEYQKGRVTSLIAKAKKDARASVFQTGQGRNTNTAQRILDSGLLGGGPQTGGMFGFGPAQGKKSAGKPHKTVSYETTGKKPTHQEIHNFLMTSTRYLDSPKNGALYITKQK